MTTDAGDTLLQGVRVLDLAGPRGEMAGRVLSDMGADVIKVEPPGGVASRRLPPFSESEPGRSLYWAAMGFGKRSVVIDLEDEEGRTDLHALLATADVLVETGEPGEMAALGLGYDDIKARYPSLVYVSITPYGSDGPWAMRPASDLTIEAAGGLVGLQGDGDRPPVPVGFPQASIHAGVQAAADTAIALRERERSGLGQHLDVSQQAAIIWTLMHATGFPPNTGDDPPGTSAQRAQTASSSIFPVHPCKDGYATFSVVPGGLGLRHATIFMRWVAEEGELAGELADIDVDEWSAELARLVQEDLPEAMRQTALAAALVHDFISRRTMDELFERAVADGFMLAPLYTVADIARDKHLEARGFWLDIDGHRYPGPFAKLSRTPMRMERAAPTLGQDQALLAELDRGAPSRSVTPSARYEGPRSDGAYAGLKVADFAWVGVGPLISKSLADHGATVVHVESATRPDVLRLGPPFKDGKPGLDNGQFMANFNASKLGLALQLNTPQGLEFATQLVEWADVVVESFTPGTLARWGLDYATLSARRPELIMLSTCLRGQSGPQSSYPGFGLQGACLSGLHRITGWPDRQPAGTWGAYTDFINPRFGSGVIAAAIRYRDLTGQGQHIDLAQTESAMHFSAPLLLDYFENGRVQLAPGHDSLYACPHGVFATEGVERYVAIVTDTTEQWRALCAAAGLDAWTGAEYDDFATRAAAKQEIEREIGAWCAVQHHDAVIDQLSAVGVPVALVQRPSDLYVDPQVEHRGFFVTLDHSVMGPTPYDGHVTRFSGSPGKLRKAAPALGEDTHYVLSELLDADDAAIVAAVGAGALQ